MVNAQYDWPMTNRELVTVLESEFDDPYGEIHHYETDEIKNSQGTVVLQGGLHVDETFYSAPKFAVSPDIPSSLPYPVVTRQATASIAYSDYLSSIDVTIGGDYESTPTVSLTPNKGASATAVLSSRGRIKQINLTNAGTGYEYPPIITFTGGVSSVSATARLDENGAISAILLDGIKYDTTNSNQIYEFGNGTTIAPNGSGTGSTGGFNIGSTHLRFGDATGVRYAVLNPVDTRQINTVRVYAIRGNGSNGGETPDINGVEDLYLQYEIAPVGDAPSGNWVDLGIIIDAVPNGSGSGVLDNYDFTLPEELKNENVYFRLYQPGNSGSDYDHYGILSVNFINLDTEYDVAGSGILISPNPLDTNPSNIDAATANIIFGRKVDSVVITNPGANWAGTVPTVSFAGGSETVTAQANATVSYQLTPNITDAGLGYESATATITGGGGTGATVVVNTNNNSVSSLLLTSGGTGYTSAPNITISAPTVQEVIVNEGDVQTIGDDTWKYTGATWLRQVSKSFKYNNGNGTYVLKNGNEISRPVTVAEYYTSENEKKRQIYLLKPTYFKQFVDDFRKKNLYKKDANFISQRLKKTG